MFRSRQRLTLTFALLIALFLPATARDNPDLVIVHTNDLHAHYRPFRGRGGETRGGLAKIAARIRELRNEHGDRMIYIDAGDLFVGTPFHHFYRGSLGMEILSLIGCEAMALGNHELDDGPLNFRRAAIGAPFPILCANLHDAAGNSFLPPSTILEAGGLRIEVIGLITSDLGDIVGCVADGEMVVRPAAQALADYLGPGLNEGIDLRLALTHCGIDEDRQIAAAVPEIPLIIGGHSHTFLEEPILVGETTICQTGCYGYNLGVLEAWRSDDGWRFEERLEAVTDKWPEDPEVLALVEEASLVVDREMSVVVGQVTGSFTGSNKYGQPDPLGICLAETMRQALAADIGLQNCGGYRTDLPAGPVTRELLFTLLPFDNRLLKLSLRGSELQELFDYLAQNLSRGPFGQISGARYEIGDRGAVSIEIGGEPLDPGKIYTVATLDFLYSGGDGYTVLAKALSSEESDWFGRDLMEARLREGFSPKPADYPPNFEAR